MFERRYYGLLLYPLDFVSERLDESHVILADLDGFPRYQVLRWRQQLDDLVGYRGAAAFDFYSSHFRTER